MNILGIFHFRNSAVKIIHKPGILLESDCNQDKRDAVITELSMKCQLLVKIEIMEHEMSTSHKKLK